jgi:hypothetical protein
MLIDLCIYKRQKLLLPVHCQKKTNYFVTYQIFLFSLSRKSQMIAKLGFVLQESLPLNFASSTQSLQNLSGFLWLFNKFFRLNLRCFLLLFLTLVAGAPVLFIFQNHQTFFLQIFHKGTLTVTITYISSVTYECDHSYCMNLDFKRTMQREKCVRKANWGIPWP